MSKTKNICGVLSDEQWMTMFPSESRANEQQGVN